jgi:hypothetical protein
MKVSINIYLLKNRPAVTNVFFGAWVRHCGEPHCQPKIRFEIANYIHLESDCLLGCCMCSLVEISEVLIACIIRAISAWWRRRIPEDSHLHTRRRKDLKSRLYTPWYPSFLEVFQPEFRTTCFRRVLYVWPVFLIFKSFPDESELDTWPIRVRLCVSYQGTRTWVTLIHLFKTIKQRKNKGSISTQILLRGTSLISDQNNLIRNWAVPAHKNSWEGSNVMMRQLRWQAICTDTARRTPQGYMRFYTAASQTIFYNSDIYVLTRKLPAKIDGKT